MEKSNMGLSVAELETQKGELLPDRIEMARRKFRNTAISGNVTFGDTFVGTVDIDIEITEVLD